MECIFCDIISGAKKGYLIYEDEKIIVFLDRFPIDRGHCLVVPKEHHERITDMDSADVAAMFGKIPDIASAVLKGMEADAFTLAQNNGKAAKQIVPHVHVHIIPRYEKTGPEWQKRRIPDEDELEDTARRITKML